VYSFQNDLLLGRLGNERKTRTENAFKSRRITSGSKKIDSPVRVETVTPDRIKPLKYVNNRFPITFRLRNIRPSYSVRAFEWVTERVHLYKQIVPNNELIDRINGTRRNHCVDMTWCVRAGKVSNTKTFLNADVGYRCKPNMVFNTVNGK